MNEDTHIVLDTDAIHQRVGSADWYFNLDTRGRLVIVIRRRNVVEVLNAAIFQKQPLIEKQKI
jgi:hypothetical protein